MGGKTTLPITFSIPLLVVLMFHLVCESMVIPVLVPSIVSPISAEHDMLIGASEAMRKFAYGVALASYPIILFFCSPIIGSLSDFYGKRKVLIWMLIISVVGCIIQGIALGILSFFAFLIGRVIVGATAGVDGTIQAALVEKCATENQKNFYLGASLFAMCVGVMIGPAFAGFFISENSSELEWALPFLIAGALFVLSAITLYFSMPKHNTTSLKVQKNTFSLLTGLTDIVVLFKDTTSRRLLRIFYLNQIAAGAFLAVMPIILASQSGFSAREVAYYLSIEGCVAGVMCAIVGPFSLKKFSARSLLIFSMGLSVLTVLVPIITTNYFAMWGLSVLHSMGFALAYYIVVAMFSESSTDEKRGWTLSVVSSFWGLTCGLGLALCGVLSGYSNIACVCGCLVLCVGAFYLAIRFSGINKQPR